MSNPFSGTGENPFSGQQALIPPLLQPMTYVDYFGRVMSLVVDPSGTTSYWEQIGEEGPKGHEPPAGQGIIPADVLRRAQSINAMDEDALIIKSAIGVTRNAANENTQTHTRWLRAWLDWRMAGRGAQEPPLPEPYYQIAHYADVLYYISRGIPVPRRPEINYNQPTYPAQPQSPGSSAG